MATTIASFCAEYLGAHGPSSVETIYEAAYAAGVTTARTPSSVIQAIRYRNDFIKRPDGRYTHLHHALAGTVLTHRIQSEGERGRLWIGRELEPFRKILAVRGELPASPAGLVRQNAHDSSVWDVPDGWLPSVPSGSLVGIQWTGMALKAGLAGFDEYKDRLRAARAREVLRRHRDNLSRDEGSRMLGSWAGLTEIVASALLEVPDLLAEPIPPLDELIERSPGECVRELTGTLHDAFEAENQVRIDLTMPEPLLTDLSERADILKIPVEDVINGILALAVSATSSRGTVVHQRRPAGSVYNGADDSWALREADDDPWAGPASDGDDPWAGTPPFDDPRDAARRGTRGERDVDEVAGCGEGSQRRPGLRLVP